MNPSTSSLFALAVLAVVAAYLAGSIPFGYLIARWVQRHRYPHRRLGQTGATNVGRTLGLRYFLLVLLLDLLKGYLPTIGFPWLLNRFVGSPPVDLPVLLGLAAILGHTFPIYLGFRGGKGVATSLGGVLALDPISCGFAALAFALFLLITRYVSLSALLAGVVFVAAHFLREPFPLNRDHIAMTLFSIAVLILLFVQPPQQSGPHLGRHRKPRLVRPQAAPQKTIARPSRAARYPSCSWLVLPCSALLALAGIWLYRQAQRTPRNLCRPLASARDRSHRHRPATQSIASSSPRAETASPRSARDMIDCSSTTLSPMKSLVLSNDVELDGPSGRSRQLC